MSTNRRMRRSRKQTMYLCSRSVQKDSEGSTYEAFDTPVAFVGEQWPASGKVQAQMYGEKLSYIRNVRIEGKYTVGTNQQTGTAEYTFSGMTVREKDGICIDVPQGTDPDYQIISIKPFKPLFLEVMKR